MKKTERSAMCEEEVDRVKSDCGVELRFYADSQLEGLTGVQLV